jgi:hypothetical protein
VRRLTTWLAGAAGGLAAYRAVVRRKPVPAAGAPEPDPAEELRAKLAESRAEPPEPEDVDARRRAVHSQARSALDEMRGGGET